MPAPKFALNHMAAARLDLPAFFALAARLGMTSVEIRNDLDGLPIADGASPQEVRAEAERHGVAIASINALQKFNAWNAAREAEAIALADYAQACGATALVLVPLNDGTGRGNGERQANLRVALKALKPILTSRGLIGLVEPLGFEICSLRRKSEAIEAIDAVGGADVFRLVHDTFHHHLAGEDDIFAGRTGLVHISGVRDGGLAVGDLRDPHRVLVDADDRIGNLRQIGALTGAGYHGLFSFEPFAPSVHADPELAQSLARSAAYISGAT
jgi:2-keto-myo-inositol isomerase